MVQYCRSELHSFGRQNTRLHSGTVTRSHSLLEQTAFQEDLGRVQAEGPGLVNKCELHWLRSVASHV